MNVLEKILEEIEEKNKIGDDCNENLAFIDGVRYGLIEAKKIIRFHMEDGKDTNVGSNWIPIEKGLPEINKKVLATVKHSSWISDFDSKWVPENEKIYHPETQGTYLAYINENNVWIYMDEEGSENICDKEFGDNLGKIYDVVTHWQPLPEPYKGEEAAGE